MSLEVQETNHMKVRHPVQFSKVELDIISKVLYQAKNKDSVQLTTTEWYDFNLARRQLDEECCRLHETLW